MPKSKRVKDINGYIEVKGNPISKVGVFEYTGKSIDPTGSMGLDPDKIYNVYRPEEELSSDECINSFKLMPWINNHTMLGEDGEAPESVGIEGVIGEDVYFDKTDGKLKANLKAFTDNIKNLIGIGKDQLSMGYRCVYEIARGKFDGIQYDVIQRNIRGNHLALVDEGRMGPDVAVLDSMDHFSFTFDASEESEMDEELKKLLEALAAQMAQISEQLAAMQPGNGDESDEEESESEDSGDTEEETGEDTGDMEQEEDSSESNGMDETVSKELKTLRKQNEQLSLAMDEMKTNGMKTILKEVSARDSLASSLSNHIGTFDHSEMTLDEVAKYGVEKLKIACDDGEELASVKGYIHAHSSMPAKAQDSSESQGEPMSSLDEYINKGAA